MNELNLGVKIHGQLIVNMFTFCWWHCSYCWFRRTFTKNARFF